MSIKDATCVQDITSEDLIDSRDLLDLREVLTEWLDLTERDAYDEAAFTEDDARAMLDAIQEFEDMGAADWQYGATFIRATYFEEYARDLAEDIGSVPSDYSWPASHIDWVAAAEALQQDYMLAPVAGVDYWVHA